MADIWQRTRILLGDRAMEKLQHSHILVVGLGGVGSYAAEAITRLGVGHITIVDSDRIETSNLNRQLPAMHSTLGEFKTRAVAARMLDINPALDLTGLPFAITPKPVNGSLPIEAMIMSWMRSIPFLISFI